MRTNHYLFIALTFIISSAIAQEVKCVEQQHNNHKASICYDPTQPFEHNIYSLFVDNQLIFSLVDDFADDVRLTHTIPEGLVLELPLSQGKKGKISLTGGCVPISENGIEAGRICNFSWGKKKVIDNVRFDS